MRKIFSLIILLTSLAYGQGGYFDAPFGGGGGYVPSWYVPDVDAINMQLKGLDFPEVSTGGLFTSGGAGFIYIGFVPGLRIGGMGFSGSSSESVTSGGREKESVISIGGGGGLTVEYSLPWIRSFGAVSVGAVIGGGSLEYEIFNNKSSYTWDEAWQMSPGNSMIEDGSRTFTNSYWLFSPALNVDIPVYRFVVFRIGAGYQFTFGSSWTIDNDKPLSGVPGDITGNSFFIQSGIFIGFFSF